MSVWKAIIFFTCLLFIAWTILVCIITIFAHKSFTSWFQPTSMWVMPSIFIVAMSSATCTHSCISMITCTSYLVHFIWSPNICCRVPIGAPTFMSILESWGMFPSYHHTTYYCRSTCFNCLHLVLISYDLVDLNVANHWEDRGRKQFEYEGMAYLID